MSIIFSNISWEDYQYWLSNDKRKIERINKIIKDCLRNPFEGIGKPEPLKHNLKGCWSRRIDDEYRFVYELNSGDIFIISCRNHY